MNLLNLPNSMTVGQSYSDWLGDESEPEYEECSYCSGDGFIDIPTDTGEDMSVTCPKCKVHGQIRL